MAMANYALHWEETIPFIWGDELVVSLDRLLRKLNAKKVLDCACGTGFPAIDLAQVGHDITASDADKFMLSRFQYNAEQRDMRIPRYLTRWKELSSRFDKKFDFIIARGNSLVYASSWSQEEGQFDSFKADEEIKKSLEGIFSVTSPGGYFYVDITNLNEIEGTHDFGVIKINGTAKSLKFEIQHNTSLRHRIVTSTLTENGSQKQRIYHSYFLPHARLVQLIHEAGFSSIDQYVPMRGENAYSVFLASKR